MLAVVRNFGLILKLIPLIQMAVATVESITSPDTPGPKKKELVLGLLSDALERLRSILGPAAYDIVSYGIDLVVRAYNLVGMFRHKGDPEAADEPLDLSNLEDAPVITRASVDKGVVKAREEDPELDAFLSRMSG